MQAATEKNSAVDLQESFLGASRQNLFSMIKDTVADVIQNHLAKTKKELAESEIDMIASVFSLEYYKLSPRLVVTDKGNIAFACPNLEKPGYGATVEDKSYLYVLRGETKQVSVYRSKGALKEFSDRELSGAIDILCSETLYRAVLPLDRPHVVDWTDYDMEYLPLEMPEIKEVPAWPNKKSYKALKQAIQFLPQGLGERIRSKKTLAEGVRYSLKKKMPEMIKASWQSFINSLDSDLVLEYSNERKLNLGDYNFCSEAKTPESRKYRVQWLKSFPFFVDHRNRLLHREIIPVIDEARPFNKEFAAVHGVSAALVKRLAPLGYDKLRNSSQPSGWELRCRDSDLDSRNFLKLLGNVPVSNVPDLKGGLSASACNMWLTMTVVWDLSSTLAGCDNVMRSSEINGRLIANSHGRWDKEARVLRGLWAYDLGDVVDFFRASYRSVLVPLMLRDMSGEQIAKLDTLAADLPGFVDYCNFMIDERAPGQLFKLSKQWHKLIGNTGRFRQSEVTNYWWKPLCSEQEAPGGIMLYPLSSSSALREEGSIMGHCVGGYDHACATSGTHIVSIRDSVGEHLGTLELIEENGKVIRRQLKGKFNRRVTETVSEAAGWLVKQINSEKIEVDYEDLRKERKKYGAYALCQFDSEDEKLCREAFGEFRWALPAGFRKLDWDNFTEHPEIQALLKTVSEAGN